MNPDDDTDPAAAATENVEEDTPVGASIGTFVIVAVGVVNGADGDNKVGVVAMTGRGLLRIPTAPVVVVRMSTRKARTHLAIIVAVMAVA